MQILLISLAVILMLILLAYLMLQVNTFEKRINQLVKYVEERAEIK